MAQGIRPEPTEPRRNSVRTEFRDSRAQASRLERLQALMRSSIPDGDLAKIIDVPVTEELERIEAKRFAKTKAPRKALAETDTAPSSRRVPAAVRRAVDSHPPPPRPQTVALPHPNLARPRG